MVMKMRTIFKAAMLAATLGVTSIAAIQPAEARGGDAGVAIVAGIVGLGLGAAIASSDHPHYAPAQYGYAPQQPYYGQGYYAQPYAYGYGGYDNGYGDRRWDEARRGRWQHDRDAHRRDWQDRDGDGGYYRR